MKTNNELFVYIKKKIFISYYKKKKGKKNQPLQAERTHSWLARKAFQFPPQTCLPLNLSYLLALLNLVKWDTDEGINSHVVYGGAPIKPQYSWIKWVLLHRGDQKSFACYHSSATQPNLISMPHDFFQRSYTNAFIWHSIYNRKYLNLGASFTAFFTVLQWQKRLKILY